jgi:hypothetical protein
MVMGVVEQVWRHTRRGDKYVTVIIDLNGRLEHLRGSALGFRNLTNYIARSLLETGGFRPRLHPALVKSRSSWGSAKDTTETGNQ